MPEAAMYSARTGTEGRVSASRCSRSCRYLISCSAVLTASNSALVQRTGVQSGLRKEFARCTMH